MQTTSKPGGDADAPPGNAFTLQQRVRFGHIDHAGIAYYPRIFNFIHEAFEDLWDNFVGVNYDELMVGQRIGFPLVHSEADFRRGLHFGDRPLVRITCFHLGRTSLGLHYRYTVEDAFCVGARMTTACVNLDTMKPMPIPEAYRARFREIMER